MTDSHSEEMRELASLYALGSLDMAEAGEFERHLDEGCEVCAAEVRSFDSVLEQLAWASIVARPPVELREKLLTRIALEATPSKVGEGETAPLPAAHTMSSQPFQSSPSASVSPVPGILTIRASEGEWQETEDAGVFVKMLFSDEAIGVYTRLVRMSPGARIPRHRHTGVEQCFVLEGDLRTIDAVNVSGDFLCAQPGTVHDELTTEQGALLLIVAPESYEVHHDQPRHNP
ncbi:MAG TPA: cupin domain-containing protein [Pyrinomonadaceae bacterium]|jgi:quercetin dioxygenase-like cupin family protein